MAFGTLPGCATGHREGRGQARSIDCSAACRVMVVASLDLAGNIVNDEVRGGAATVGGGKVLWRATEQKERMGRICTEQRV